MIKRIVYAAAGIAALGALATIVLGTSTFINLLGTGRQKIQETAREYIDPQVELEAAVRQAEGKLPKAIVGLRMALSDTEKELASQAKAIGEATEGLRLIEADLKTLAAAIHGNSGCELRGKHLSPEQAAREAARLMQKRKDYQNMVERRTTLVAKIREQKKKMEQELAAAETLAAEFASKARQVEGKIALTKAVERLDSLTKTTRGLAVGVPANLEQLDRDLDRRLAETEERTKLREGLSTDEYAEAAGQARLLDELKELYPGHGDKEE